MTDSKSFISRSGWQGFLFYLILSDSVYAILGKVTNYLTLVGLEGVLDHEAFMLNLGKLRSVDQTIVRKPFDDFRQGA